MAGKLTEKEIMDMKHAFEIFDTNGDGFIKKLEIKEILVSLGKAGLDKEVDKIIKEVDTDGDGLIDFPEFLNMMSRDCMDSGMQSEGALDHMFKIFDRDGDGYITHLEMKKVVGELEGGKVDHSEIEEMIKEADSDGDGKVSYCEFVAIMKAKHPQQYT